MGCNRSQLKRLLSVCELKCLDVVLLARSRSHLRTFSYEQRRFHISPGYELSVALRLPSRFESVLFLHLEPALTVLLKLS